MPWIDIERVGFAFDDGKREMRLTMDGSGVMGWQSSNGWRTFQIVDSSMAFNPSFKRDPGPDAAAPYAVQYPSYDAWKVVVALPDKGRGFGLMAAEDVDQTVAGVRYRRHSRIVDGVVTMTESEQALAPEFPASEAAADAQALRQLNANDVTITYQAASGSEPAPDATTQDQPPAPPTDAAGFEARGAGHLASDRYAAAIEDFERAARLDPSSSEYAYNLGVALFDAHSDA
ncbi:MAG: hypothetical protein ACREEQ_10300, partial [Caulobacteraceae bacterium]